MTNESSRAQGEFSFFLDHPTDWSRKVRRLRLTGWCVANEGEPLVAIRAQLHGKIFEGHFNCERADVAAHLGLGSTRLRCGFMIAVEVPHGTGQLEVRVARSDGLWRKVFAHEVTGPWRMSANERSQIKTEAEIPGRMGESDSRFSFWLDQPKEWHHPIRHLRISGWSVATSGPEITEVRARLGRKIFRGHYGAPRPDVAVMIEQKQTGLRSGFFVDLVVPWGRSKLFLEARSGEGNWERFFTRKISGPIFWGRSGRFEDVGNYPDWIFLHDRITRGDRSKIRRQISQFKRRPLFSVIVPVHESHAPWLRRAIASVRRQLYPNWELCLVDDASVSPQVWPILQRAARADSRVKILRREKNGHICAASNDALEMATGEFIALLDHDDELAPTALYFAALELERRPDLQLLYSDEDKLDPDGRRCDPYFKSDWNPDLLDSQNYVSHLSIFAAELARRVGGFRAGFEGSQDYDLTLRCAEKITPTQIHHIPHVLYHWRMTEQSTAAAAAVKPYAQLAAQRAVQEHVDRGLTSGQVVPGYANYLQVRYQPPPGSPLVSIIIPTRDRFTLLQQCVESIRAKTDYPNFEIIVIDNESRDEATLEYLTAISKLERIEILRVAGEFNFSQLNNVGVEPARGEFVAFLNNDLEVMNADWLSEMISHAARPEVGAVGARLWYPDGRLQHGGVLLGLGGIANHAHRLLRMEHGYFARARLTQNFSAVTGACLVMRKKIFQEIGGFDATNLPVSFNDVDLCGLRLRERDLLIVWTPVAELIHHESASRGYEDTGAKQERLGREVAYMQARWGYLLEADPYYNPNFALGIDQQFQLAFPPRVEKPWNLA